MNRRRQRKRYERWNPEMESRSKNDSPPSSASGKQGLSWPVLVASSLLLFALGVAADRFFSTLSPGPPIVAASTETPAPALPLPEGEKPQGTGDGESFPGSSGSLGRNTTPDSPAGNSVSPPPPDPALFHKEAVRETIHKNFPLTPGDIDLIKKTVSKTQKAIHGPPPVGRAISVPVSLDPGAQFPEIRLVPGIATTIAVVDATGAPWPIEDVIVGNEKSFPVKRLSTSNGVVVEPKNNVGWTSLALSLAGRGTPAVLKLVDSDHLSDTRVTARIEARGPNARTPVFQEAKPVVSARILAFLDGIAPPEAREMHVTGTKDMEAWLFGDRLFVRTHMDVLAPAWIETVSGPNGMKLYVFSPVSVITAAGEDGDMVTVELGEGETDVRKR